MENLDKDRFLEKVLRENTQLKQANNLLEQVFQMAGVGIQLIDKDFNIIRVNDTFAKMSNFANSELVLGKKCYDLLNGGLCHTEACPLSMIIKDAGNIEVEFVKESTDGRKIHYHILGQPIFSLEGEIIGVLQIFRDISQHKQALEAIKKSEQQFRSYIQNSPDGIAIIDQNGKYMIVNRALCDLLGYTESEFLKLTVRQTAASKKLGHFQRLVETGLSKGEVQLVKKDGSFLLVDLHAVVLDDGCYLGFFRDITDWKEAEKALQREVEFNAIIAQLSHMFLSSTNVEQIALMLLEKAVRLTDSKYGFNGFIDPKTGYFTFSNLVENVTDIYPMDKQASVFKEYRGLWGWVLENKEPLLVNVATEDPRSTGVPPGHPPIHRVLSVPALIGDKLVGQITVANSERHYTERDLKVLERLADIYAIALQRAHIEQKIRESEHQYDLILNGIRDAVTLYEVIDQRHFRYLKANETLFQLLGLPPGEVIGRFIQEIVPPEIADIWIEMDHRAVRAKKMIIDQVTLPYGIFENKYIPVIDQHGDCTHLVVVAQNVTERKKAEEQLLKTQKLESVGLLAGGIAHDFNNILTAITGNVSLAKLKIANTGIPGIEAILSLLGEAEKAALEAKNLTQQLLTFAKGGAPILKTTSIKELLRETVEFALRGSNVKCVFTIPEGLWTVEVDEGQISQVIHNIIINADQAMPGGGTVEIMAENTLITFECPLPLREGIYVKISIKDSGVGIPREYLGKIFDPYFSTRQKGSGLGLTTSYAIIRKHNGLIEVESKPGVGTTFQIYLPAIDAPVENEQERHNRLATGEGKVLVMDDDEMLRYVLGEMLQHLGYEVACARDGREAIDLYRDARKRNKPFDAVIMDLTIPGGMGGKEAIEELVDIDPQVAAIVSSGYSNDPVMSEYQKYGFKDVVSKPFSIEELAEVLRTVIGNN